MNLSHDPADIIRHALTDAALGTLPSEKLSWPANVNNEPNDPDNCITVYNTTGTVQGRLQATGEFQDRPGIQIRVRGATYAVAYAKIKTIQTYLEETVARTVVLIGTSQYLVHSLNRTSDLLHNGKDVTSSKRYTFTVNYYVSITQEN